MQDLRPPRAAARRDLGRAASACALAFAACVAACGSDAAVTEPEGGLDAFVVALASGNTELVYQRLSADTHLVCEQALEAWRQTAEAIELLQASDQTDARAATGVEALERIDSPTRLFEAMTDLTALPVLSDSNRYTSGLKPRDTVAVAANTVIVVTRSGQEFEMVVGDDGQWRVREPMYSLVTGAVARLHANRERVEDAVRLFGVGAEIDDELRTLGLLD